MDFLLALRLSPGSCHSYSFVSTDFGPVLLLSFIITKQLTHTTHVMFVHLGARLEPRFDMSINVSALKFHIQSVYLYQLIIVATVKNAEARFE